MAVTMKNVFFCDVTRATRHHILEDRNFNNIDMMTRSQKNYEEWCLLGCYTTWLL
jgi:hypothetical protein